MSTFVAVCLIAKFVNFFFSVLAKAILALIVFVVVQNLGFSILRNGCDFVLHVGWVAENYKIFFLFSSV